jgi:acyl dehydratase
MDADAARAKGYRDVLAPPTFLITVAGSTGPGLLSDPALRLNFSLVVHGRQGFTLHRPVCAGDVLESETRIHDVRDSGRNELISLITEFTSAGSPVATLRNTIVSRGTAAEAT